MSYVEDSGIDFSVNRDALVNAVDLATKQANDKFDVSDGFTKAHVNNLVRALKEFTPLISACDRKLTDLSFVFETVAYLSSGKDYPKNKKTLVKAIKGNAKAANAIAEMISDDDLADRWREWAIANGFVYKRSDESVDDMTEGSAQIDNNDSELDFFGDNVSESKNNARKQISHDEEIIRALHYNNEVSDKVLAATESLTKTMATTPSKGANFVVVDSNKYSSYNTSGTTAGQKAKRILIFLLIVLIIDVIYTGNFMRKQFSGDYTVELAELNAKQIKRKVKPEAVGIKSGTTVIGVIQYRNERLLTVIPVNQGCSVPIKLTTSGMPDKVRWWITNSDGNVVKNGVCTGKTYDVFTAKGADMYTVHMAGARGSELSLSVGTKMSGFDRFMYYLNRPFFMIYQKLL